MNYHLLRAEFGIEKESLRVDTAGYLAQTRHPDIKNPKISRDFGESQVEFISGVHDNLRDACDEICSLQRQVEHVLKNRANGAEFMWTYSNPPLFLGEGGIRIAEFAGAKENKTTYREYLADKYGKVKMLFSGLHLNYSAPKEFFERLSKQFPDKSMSEMKNEWYVKLCDVMMSDSWLIVALTAASPVADARFLDGLSVPKEERDLYASFRNSPYGYWNLFCPELSYRDFPSYLDSVSRYIESGDISSVQELYYPVRLKPAGENSLKNLCKRGVNHLELRMLDLNPMCCAGVAKRDLIFIHLLIAYRSAQLLNGGLEERTSPADQDRLFWHMQAARFSFWEEQEGRKRSALRLISDMKRFFLAYAGEEMNEVPGDYDIMEVLDFEAEKITDPDARYANQIRAKYKGNYIEERMDEILGGRI